MNHIGKQNVWGDANSGDLVIKKKKKSMYNPPPNKTTQLKGALSKHMCINKECLSELQGKLLYSFWDISMAGCLPEMPVLSCIQHGFREEELCVCMQLQSYDFIGIMKIC